jgi:hypothetical protein
MREVDGTAPGTGPARPAEAMSRPQRGQNFAEAGTDAEQVVHR